MKAVISVLNAQYPSGEGYRCLAALYCSGYFCAAREFSLLFHISNRRQTSQISCITYCTFFCVYSRSFCTSRAACMPSAKFALDFASRALACACRARSSRFFALSSPDLLELAEATTCAIGTHICACFTILRSSGTGLYACESRSPM